MSSHKKSFEFRMSKKVAELTQVIHLLFTHNHEKDVETEALRDAYEDEIDEVITDAKSRIAVLDQKLVDAEQKRLQNLEEQRENFFKELAIKDDEWKQRYQTLEDKLREEKSECQNVRDLLINLQKDLERLRHSHSAEQARCSKGLGEQSKETEKLRARIAELVRESDMLRSNHDRLTLEVSQLNVKLEVNENDIDSLTTKNRRLDETIRNLKRELSRRPDSAEQLELEKQRKKSLPETVQLSYTNYDNEIARLKRELYQCRMELGNREQNFNRVFSQTQPVVLSRPAPSSSLRLSTKNHDLTDKDLQYRPTDNIYLSSRDTRSRDNGIASTLYDDELSRNASSWLTPGMQRSKTGLVSPSSNGILPQLATEPVHRLSQPPLAKPRPERVSLSTTFVPSRKHLVHH